MDLPYTEFQDISDYFSLPEYECECEGECTCYYTESTGDYSSYYSTEEEHFEVSESEEKEADTEDIETEYSVWSYSDEENSNFTIYIKYVIESTVVSVRDYHNPMLVKELADVISLHRNIEVDYSQMEFSTEIGYPGEMVRYMGPEDFVETICDTIERDDRVYTYLTLNLNYSDNDFSDTIKVLLVRTCPEETAEDQ
ncbi:hypothetical protein H4219_005887 [Mycoemilia scoparia]|uniref:Uncharacterized protein n=1 Tax=Mycoemilia scoparia TaxID=417184 RepID=A0A9W8DNH6_9FUNG|nr:hypothetical protein H4219_005887 [Mycoemilia scoparia]